jgi:hypothetical protein
MPLAGLVCRFIAELSWLFSLQARGIAKQNIGAESRITTGSCPVF